MFCMLQQARKSREDFWLFLGLPERMKDMPVIVYVIRFDCL